MMENYEDSAETQTANALCNGFIKAEIALGLNWDEPPPLKERAQRILQIAMHSPLDPQLYELAWFVRRTARRSEQTALDLP
jgi:hypothetical protein